MNNLVMKLMIYNVLICGLMSNSAVFGMENKRVTPYVAQGNLYTRYGCGKYAPFKEDGTASNKYIFDESSLKPPTQFRGDIVRLEDDKYYIEAKVQYGRCTEVKEDSHTDLGRWHFFVPIDLTIEQLKKLINIRQQGQFAGSIFALDDKGNQFYINDIECDINDECILQPETEILIEKPIKFNNNRLYFSMSGLAILMVYVLYVGI